MSLARRAAVAFVVVFLVAVGSSTTVFLLARSSATDLTRYRERVAALDAAMWGLRSGFYNYDDQMNMYVAVLAGGGPKDDLAETTYQQAVQAREAMRADLSRAVALNRAVGGPGAAAVQDLLARLERDLTAYDGFADRTREAGLAGRTDEAVYLSTRGNLEPSNDIMPTLDRATALVRRAVAAELSALQDRQRRLELVSVVSAAVVAVLIGLLAAGNRFLVVRRLVELRDVMTRIGSGRADRGTRVAVPEGAGEADEITALGRAFNRMLVTLEEREDDVAASAAEREEQAQHAFEHQRRAELQVRDRAQAIIDETAGTVAEELRRLVLQVEAVRDAAATIEAKTVAADGVTREVVAQAGQADTVVGELQASLREVAGMTQLIATIADQTKLLALNATIEAARAGEAGKGFAVVASEVKELAGSTATSTQRITTTITALEQHSQAVADAIGTMGRGITGVDEATGALHAVAGDQFAVVEALTEQVTRTLERVESMSGLTEKLERRHHRRVPVTGSVDLDIAGRRLTGRLTDVSAGGLRASTAPGQVPGNGQALQASFSVFGQAFSLSGHVVPHGPAAAPGELGIEFDRPDPALARLLENRG